jgi:hypothetical protein
VGVGVHDANDRLAGILGRNLGPEVLFWVDRVHNRRLGQIVGWHESGAFIAHPDKETTGFEGQFVIGVAEHLGVGKRIELKHRTTVVGETGPRFGATGRANESRPNFPFVAREIGISPMCGSEATGHDSGMPNSYLLSTIIPSPGHEMAAITNALEAKAIVAKYDPLAVAWRTAIGGPSTGHIHVSMGWDSFEALGQASEAMAADPAYRAFNTKVEGANPLATLRQTIAGFDIPGLAAPRIPAYNGRPRAMMAVMYPRSEQTIELVASARELLEADGATWFGRLWSMGMPGMASTLVSYSVFPDQPSLGKFIDMQLTSDKHRAMLAKLTPHIIGRRWLNELPG